MRGLAVCLFLLASLVGPSLADEDEFYPVEPGKINTNDAGVLEPGQVELQPGYAVFYSDRAYDGAGRSRPDSSVKQDLVATQLTFGVVPDFDVNLMAGLAGGHDSQAGTDPFTSQPFLLSDHSLSDITFGTRWRFYQDEDQGLALAYLTYTTFPTAQHGSDQGLSLSQEVATLAHRLVVQKELGHWSLLADLGFLHPLASNGPGFELGLSASVAAGYQLTEDFQPLVEVSYNNACYSRDPFSDSWTVTGGATYYTSPDVRLNLGVTQTVAGHNTRDGLGVTFFVTIAR